MGALSKGKKDLLDKWAADAAKGTAKKAEVDPVSGAITKPSQEDEMMATIGAELTEQALDAAVAKAKAR